MLQEKLKKLADEGNRLIKAYNSGKPVKPPVVVVKEKPPVVVESLKPKADLLEAMDLRFNRRI